MYNVKPHIGDVKHQVKLIWYLFSIHHISFNQNIDKCKEIGLYGMSSPYAILEWIHTITNYNVKSFHVVFLYSKEYGRDSIFI